MEELVISILLMVVIIMAAALLIFVGSRKDGMTKKQRVMMIRILLSAGILLALQFISAEMFDTAYAGPGPRFLRQPGRDGCREQHDQSCYGRVRGGQGPGCCP